MTRILVVEDEATVRETLALNLRAEGYEVITAADGEVGLNEARTQTFDLFVLDVMLPKLDGLSLCRLLRKDSTVPILILTARSTEVDKIVGLESGADDYIVKPFGLGEFLARVRAALRRASTATAVPSARDRLEVADLTLDLISRRAYKSGQELRLTHKEFDLLAELMRNTGAVLSRDLLLQKVWGYEFSGDSRTVDVHVRWLREKIETDPAKPTRLTTVRGVGYRLEG